MSLDDILKIGIDQLTAQQRIAKKYADYYDGNHPLGFASEKFQSTFGSLFRTFADNLCPSVVDSVADRLEVIGFSEDGDSKTLAEEAWNIWNLNRMDKMAGKAHTEVLKTGNALLIVWKTNGSPAPSIFVNSSEVCTVGYEDSDSDTSPAWASWWTSGDGSNYR